MVDFIASPNCYHGRRKPLLWVVWHSTEGNETPGAARGLARNWFGKPSAGVSAHIVADATEVIECVKPGDTAWHCANGNASGYGIEIVGKAGQTSTAWNDPYSRAALTNAARWVKGLPALAHIPTRWLSDAQLKAGERGHITHYQVARVLGGTTHTDPGPNFPYGFVMQQLGQNTPVVPATPQPTPVPALPTVKLGDRGPAVLALQKFMVKTFPTYNRYTPTALYGAQTQAGIREFQARAGVQGSPLDGSIVGPATNRALARFGYRG